MIDDDVEPGAVQKGGGLYQPLPPALKPKVVFIRFLCFETTALALALA